MKISKALFSGIKWASFSKVIRIVLQYVTLLVLAYYLSPSDFGLMGTAMIFIGFFNIIKDFGITIGLIQFQEYSDELYSSVFWLNILIGLFLFTLLFFSAKIIANFYDEQMLKNLLQVLSLNFIINSLTILPQTIFEKELKFNITAKIEIIGSIIGASFGIVMAFYGFGVWALVFQYLGFSISSMLLVWIYTNFKPKFIFKILEIKKILSFGLNLSGYNIVNYFVRNMDYFLIGKFIGMEQLGYYSLAYRIMLFPIQNITAVVAKVSYPAISKIKDNNEQIKVIYTNVVKSIAFVSFPAMIGLFVTSDIFVNVFFSQKWLPIIDILYILIPVGMLQSVYTMVGVLFQAKNKTDIWFKWGIFSAVITIAGFVIGLKWGIIGVAISYLITNLLLFYPVSKIAFKFIDMSVLSFISKFSRIFIISLLMGLLIWLSKQALEQYLTTNLLFIIIVINGILMYVLFSFLFNKEFSLRILKKIKP